VRAGLVRVRRDLAPLEPLAEEEGGAGEARGERDVRAREVRGRLVEAIYKNVFISSGSE
jgi:hypothetical protein